MSNYAEQPLIPLEEFKFAEQPSQNLRVAFLCTLRPGLQGDLVLKSTQTALQHLQTSHGQSKLVTLHKSLPALHIQLSHHQVSMERANNGLLISHREPPGLMLKSDRYSLNSQKICLDTKKP